MAEFIVTPQDYLPGGRLYNQPDIVVVEPPGVEQVEDKATGVTYTPGSRAITVTKATYGNLPKNIRDVIGGSETDTINYNPFKGMTGYAFDEKTGQVIVQNSPGNFGFLGARYQSTPSGTIIPKGSDDSVDVSGNAFVASSSGDVNTSNFSSGGTVVSTYTDPTTGDVTAVMSDGTTKILAKSGKQEAERKSAYDLLYSEFEALGVGALVPDLKTFIEEGISPAEFTLRLRQTDAYKKRFAANAQRINKGLRAISEAEYIAKEDAYQDIMRRYGLPETYYTRGEMGRQEGFEKLIASDVSDVELEDRISTAQKRVINANPEVAQALRTFYPGISQGDILAYTLDPSKAIEDIKRKVTAAEIGGAAVRAGLTTSAADAEYLQRYGVTKEQADQGYQTAAQIVPRASQLADIYKQGPYTQATAEQEIFNLPGQVEAQRQRKKLTELETSAFSGRAGVGAIARERAGNF
jgi:hypothetical protein